MASFSPELLNDQPSFPAVTLAFSLAHQNWKFQKQSAGKRRHVHVNKGGSDVIGLIYIGSAFTIGIFLFLCGAEKKKKKKHLQMKRPKRAANE